MFERGDSETAMTTLAGHTFLSTNAAQWITADSSLKQMDTFGRLQGWATVNQSYYATFMPAGMSLADMVELSTTSHEFSGEDLLPVLHAYYGTEEATAFVDHANWGTGFALGWDNTSRREMLTKGVAYRNVLYRVWQRLALGLSKCTSNSKDPGESAAPGIFEWETAWALFAGSYEGDEGYPVSDTKKNKGYSVYALGDKRCPQFSTCVGGTTSGLAAPNEGARRALEAGIAAFQEAVYHRCALPPPPTTP